METDGKKREYIEWLVSACLTFLSLAVLWKTSGCFFETNDDGFMAEILSGSLGGKPEPHIVYVNYLLSYPVSLLYRITIQIPWYGLLLLACQFLSYTAMLQSAFSSGLFSAESLYHGASGVYFHGCADGCKRVCVSASESGQEAWEGTVLRV